MIRLISIFCLLFTISFAEAQTNHSLLYAPYSGALISKQMPSRLGLDREKFDITIFSTNIWAGNNVFDYHIARELSRSDKIEYDYFEENVLNNLKRDFDMFTGFELDLFNFSFTIRSREQEVLSLGFGHRERMALRFILHENMLRLITEGNKQWVDETVDLGPVNTSALYHREYFATAAVPIGISFAGQNLSIRPGLTFKYLTGIANFDTKKGNISMYTDPDGRYLYFNYDYQFDYAYPENRSHVMTGTGRGWGIDPALSLILNDRFSFDIAMIDNGKIEFSRSVTNLNSSDDYRFEGVHFYISDREIDSDLDMEYLEEVMDAAETNDKFKMSLGTKWVVNLSAAFNEVEKGGDEDNTYFRHTLFATVIKGKENHLNAFNFTRFQIAYKFNAGNILNFGSLLGHDKYNLLSIGPFVSVKGGPFVFTFGSNDLSGLIPGLGNTIDGYARIGLFF